MSFVFSLIFINDDFLIKIYQFKKVMNIYIKEHQIDK